MEELFTFYRGKDVKNGDFFVDFSQKSISLLPKVLYFGMRNEGHLQLATLGITFFSV